MKINNNDYSNLLSSLNKNDTLGISLTDYASIKNNSYSKLVKAYYGKNNATQSTASGRKKASVDETTAKNAQSVKSSATDLKTAAEAVASASRGGDADKIAKSVKDFAEAYNSSVKSVDTLGNSGITRTAQSIIDSVGSNLKLLDKIGVSVDLDGKMTVNESKVKESLSTVKTLFEGVGSFGDSVASKASTITRSAEKIVKAGPSLYNSKGTSESTDSSGNIFDSIM